MNQEVGRNQTIEYLLNYIPQFHKIILLQACFNKLPRQHLQLLLYIKKDSGKPMRYYGQKLLISKPNMTTLADKLIKEGLLKRQKDENDRRIINLMITPKGEKYLEFHKNNLKKLIIKRLEVLKDKDIKKLNDSFEEIQKIFSKLDREIEKNIL